MGGREAVLEAWQAAGTELTMLPSGVEVRLDLPSLAQLELNGLTSRPLTSLVMNGGTARHAKWRPAWGEEVRELIAEAVVGIRPPGFAEVEPYRLTVEDLAADPPKLPRSDLEALGYLVLRLRTPRGEDAVSRNAHGLLSDVEMIGIVAAERPRGLSAWAPFRPGRRGASVRPERENLGDPAKQPAGHRRAGGRVRAGRGAGGAAGAPQAAGTAARGG
jgi:hypothetical protein